MTTRWAGAGVAGGLAGVVTATTYRWLRTAPPGGAARWQRLNFHGRELDLLGGPAVAAATVAVPVVLSAGRGCRRAPLAAATAVAASAALGLYDDLAGATHARGLRGHLAALTRGELTTGLVKLVGLVAAAAVARRAADPEIAPLDLAVDAAVVSGSANLVNLLDLRPGRALKVVVVAGVPVALGKGRNGGSGPATALAGAATGAALALLPDDLGERTMLGDCGANALGSALGWAVVAGRARRTRLAVLAVVTGLTLLSERWSFSAVIARTPALAALDRWGRRPA